MMKQAQLLILMHLGDMIVTNQDKQLNDAQEIFVSVQVMTLLNLCSIVDLRSRLTRVSHGKGLGAGEKAPKILASGQRK